jgi:predicted AAA+ superfamily ATPase
MLPLSLGEFMDLNEMSDPKVAVRKYMTRGSLPVIHRDYTDADAREMLRDLFNSILFKDILYASDIRDPVLLENVAMYLLDNIGNTVSPAAISRYTGKDAGMIDRYLKLITGSYLFHRVDSYDLRGRKLLKTQAKYYCADVGIRHALLGEQYGDTGRIMENLVFLELIRRGYEVRIGKYGNREIDFTARKGADVIYYQVTMSLAAEYNLKREMEPFSAPRDHHRRVLITGDDVVKGSENGVEIVSLCDFLLGLD